MVALDDYGNKLLPIVASAGRWMLVFVGGCRWLQVVACVSKCLQVFAGVCKWLQVVAGACR